MGWCGSGASRGKPAMATPSAVLPVSPRKILPGALLSTMNPSDEPCRPGGTAPAPRPAWHHGPRRVAGVRPVKQADPCGNPGSKPGTHTGDDKPSKSRDDQGGCHKPCQSPGGNAAGPSTSLRRPTAFSQMRIRKPVMG